MKAAVYSRYGPPEVVEIKEVAKPIPKPDEILLKVHAGTVNRTDCGFRSADYFIVRFFSGLLKPKWPILGCEFAGEVELTGDQVRRFKKGERLFGFGDFRFGGHGEYMLLKEKSPVGRIPDHITYLEAAALSEGAHYAFHDIKAMNVKAGQHVLVNGATGAIGSAAVQLLKHYGVKVTAVCATPHADIVKSLGADQVVDYLKEDFTKRKEQFDVVFDAVGKSSFGKCKALLKKNGLYISTELGRYSQNVWLAIWGKIFGGKRVLFPIPVLKQEELDLFRDLREKNIYKPLIDRIYNLDEIVEAYRYVETGQKVGNVLIQIIPQP